MKNNPHTRPGYAQMYKENKTKEPKIEISNNNNTPNNKPRVGINFDDLKDWDNMVYSEEDNFNQIQQSKVPSLPQQYKQTSPSNNTNNNNNNLGLQDLSVNTSTFTYKVNEMGKVDKIDLSSQEDFNYGVMGGNQEIHKKIYFGGGENMISQIKPNNNVNLGNGSFHVIKEEMDEYKNFSKLSGNDTLNQDNDKYEKDSLNSEEEKKFENSYGYIENNMNNYNNNSNSNNYNNDKKYSIEPEALNYNHGLMNDIDEENELAEQQMNDLLYDIEGSKKQTASFGTKKEVKPANKKQTNNVKSSPIKQQTFKPIQQIPKPIIQQVPNPVIVNPLPQQMPTPIIQQVNVPLQVMPATVADDAIHNNNTNNLNAVTFGKTPISNPNNNNISSSSSQNISANQGYIPPPFPQQIPMYGNNINNNMMPMPMPMPINQNFPLPMPMPPQQFQNPMQLPPPGFMPMMPMGAIPPYMLQHPQIITCPPQKEEKNEKKKKKVVYKPKSMQEYRVKYVNVKQEKVGGLGPNIGTKEWNLKKEKKQKEKEYSEKIKNLNKEISEHKEQIKIMSNNNSKLNIQPVNNKSARKPEDQLYDSLTDDEGGENRIPKEEDFIPLSKGGITSHQNEEKNSNGSYSHINMLKKLKEQNKTNERPVSITSAGAKKLNKIKKPGKTVIDASKQDDNISVKKGKIYTTLKPLCVDKNKKRPQSTKLKVQTKPKKITKNINEGEDELTRMFMQNKPNEYNGVGKIRTNNSQRKVEEEPVNFDNVELNDLFQKHLNLNTQVNKIKDFLKYKK